MQAGVSQAKADQATVVVVLEQNSYQGIESPQTPCFVDVIDIFSKKRGSWVGDFKDVTDPGGQIRGGGGWQHHKAAQEEQTASFHASIYA